jgi:hypothetical protein
MIDIENKVFKIVYDAVMAHDPNIYVTSESSNTPPSFPTVYVEQIDSYDPAEFRVSSREELYAAVVFDVQVFSNKPAGKKAEVKSILAVIDDALRAAGLRRTMSNYVDLTDNRNSSVSNRNQSIIRLLGRYECLADTAGNIYARR